MSSKEDLWSILSHGDANPKRGCCFLIVLALGSVLERTALCAPVTFSLGSLNDTALYHAVT